MSITKETVKNLLCDAGVVYLNYGLEGERVLGATEGGNTFTIEREIREIPVDGARGKVKGLRRIVSENAKLTVNLKEMSAENIRLALAGAAVSDYPSTGEKTHDEIRSTGEIGDTDYANNVALVARLSGTNRPVVCVIENALADGNFEIGGKDKEEAVVPVEFSAHFDPEDMSTVPWAVRYPVMDLSDVTTIYSHKPTVVLVIDNTLGSESVTVAVGTTCAGLLAAIRSTDGSAQTYVIKSDSGEEKSGTDALVTGDTLTITAENETDFAEYAITVQDVE